MPIADSASPKASPEAKTHGSTRDAGPSDATVPVQTRDDRLKSIRPGAPRFALNVIASSVADVVASIGGWLFDRRAAGWDVNVLVTEVVDMRPLKILGVDAIDPQCDLAADWALKTSAGLAIALDRFVIDDGLRVAVLNAVKSSATEVAMWGNGRPSAVGDLVESVDYRMSRAAKAFKVHALAAAGLSDRQTGQTERLYRVGLHPTDSVPSIVG